MDQYDNRSVFGNGEQNQNNNVPPVNNNTYGNTYSDNSQPSDNIGSFGSGAQYTQNAQNTQNANNQYYGNQNNAGTNQSQQFSSQYNPQFGYTPNQNNQSNGYGYQQYSQQQQYGYNNHYTPTPVKEEKPKKSASKGFVIGMVALGLVMSMLFGTFISSVLSYGSNNNSDSSSSSTVVVKHEGDSSKASDVVSDKGTAAYAASIALDSVVEINTESVTYNSFYGQMISSGAGSGVIISSDESGTYIITCAHVIEDAKTVTVILTDGTKYEAVSTAYDTISDIGVIKINASNLKAVTVSDDSLVIAQEVIAIGNPLGELGGSVSRGIVSSLEREITIDGINYTLIQTDASINAGNSGGGLFDLNGNLVGIVNAKSTGTSVEGLGFAIPVDDAMKIFNELVTNGYVSGRVQLGVKVIDIQSSSDIYNYPQYYKYFTDYGVYIVEADSEEFETGDRIVSIDSTEVSCYNDLRNLLLDYNVGDTVSVQVSRISSTSKHGSKTELVTIEVVLTEKTAED